MVSVKAAATGKVSWGPMVSGLGPLEQTKTNREQQIHFYTKLVLAQNLNLNQLILRKIRLKWRSS